MLPSFYNRSAATMPPTTATPLAKGLSATAFEVDEVPAALALAVPELVGAAPEEEAAEELAVGTSLAWRVPQVLQELEPGFCCRHWAKVAWQMKLGRVFRYWSILGGGEEPLAQVQVYWRVD